MTYCVAVRIKAGLVMLSDTRTNAGVDNIARFRKTFTYEVPGERAIALMTSGNLSVTQAVKTTLSRAIKESAENPDIPTILNCPTLHDAATIVGDAMRSVRTRMREGMTSGEPAMSANIIVAGQRRGGKLRLYQVYPEGNFIEATVDTPFFQIGEHKYGKPILDRIIRADTTLDEAAKAVCVSMDSTLRSNLSVGMPLDLTVLPFGTCAFSIRRRIDQDDKEFASISRQWGLVLQQGFDSLPSVVD